ncbi:MAG: L-fucose isomerase [Blautia sp.]
MKRYPAIGIRPIVDARVEGIREVLEEKTRKMAEAAKRLIEENVFYTDGTPARCVIFSGSISGGEEAARCEEEFEHGHVCASLSVTPSWCYPTETFDRNPIRPKALWGFNGTERPGAVYLAAAMSAHNQMGVPIFSIYGRDVQDMEDDSVPEDVKEKILLFAKGALAVGEMQDKSYVSFGGVSMGIIGSYLDPKLYLKYLGMRPEWVDMTEILRRMKLKIYDPKEQEKALDWIRENCPEGYDKNPKEKQHTQEEKEKEWDFIVKMTIIMRDIMFGNEKLKELGWPEEALGKNALFAGFQGQRAWTDWLPNGDFTEAILNSSFDWNGKRPPIVMATESDNLNGLAMLFANLLTQKASGFADVRAYWSPDAVERVSGWKPEGLAEQGFIHLTNSGAACLDASAAARDEDGKPVMKPWWEMTQEDINACLAATDWCPASLAEFRGGGFSSHFRTAAQMPMTMLRVNLVDGIGPCLQVAEGYSLVLPEEVHKAIDSRTDPTWPTTWFAPRITGDGAFTDVYTMMVNWGSNHGAFAHGHIGKELLVLASMLRIPVSMNNVAREDIFRPHVWSSFGTENLEAADFQACRHFGPLYG